MKRILSLTLAAVLALALSIPAFALDDKNIWSINETRTENAIFVQNDNLGNIDTTGYKYLVLDVKIEEGAFASFDNFWIVVASEGHNWDTDTCVRIAPFGLLYSDENKLLIQAKLNGVPAGEWTQLYYPIGAENNDLFQENERSKDVDWTKMNAIRIQMEGVPGKSIEFGSMYLSENTATGGAADTTPADNGGAAVSEDPVSNVPGAEKEVTNPKTGDESLVVLAIAAFLVSASAFVVLRKRIHA